MVEMNHWSHIDKDILESIHQKLSSIDKVSCRAVCSHWRAVWKYQLSSSSLKQKLKGPLLVIEEDIKDWTCYSTEEWSSSVDGHKRAKLGKEEDSIRGNWFYSLKEKRFIRPHNNSRKFGGPTHCVGSSYGWLIFKEEKQGFETLFIYNPLLDVVIRPRDLSTLSLDPKAEPHIMGVPYVSRGNQHKIKYAVLSENPWIKNDNNYAIVVIYGSSSKLAFAKCGDTKWNLFDDSSSLYCDVLSCKGYVYAITTTGSVHAWDFNRCGSPCKVFDIKPSINEVAENPYLGPLKHVSPKPFYLVESMGELLLATRYTIFVPMEEYLVGSQSIYLYKLDFNGMQWVEYGSLGNRAVFLGGNQSVVLSGRVLEDDTPGIYCSDHLAPGYYDIGGRRRKIQETWFWVYS